MIKRILLVGNDISRYSVVLSENANQNERFAAEELVSWVEKITDNKLSIVNDSAHYEYEIVIGSTNRDNDETEKELSVLKNEGVAVFFTSAQRLYLIGEGDFGVVNAVYRLLEVFGCRFYDEETEEIIGRECVELSLDFSIKYSPVLMYRKTDWKLSREMQLKLSVNGELTRRNSIIGFCHTLGALSETDLHTQPCLSDEAVYETVLRNVRKRIADNPGCRIISVTQNDNFNYCRCEKCTQLAERENQSGVMLNFVNRLAKDIEEEYPDVYILTFAYQYTRKPPVTITPRHNVIIWLCSIECCFSHTLADKSCEQNRAFVEDTEAWRRIADNIYIWDYTTNYAHYNSPFPNFRTLLDNAKFFADHNAIGIYEEGGYQQAENGEFRSLRAYLIGKILWNPYMTHEEYNNHMNEFLACYYGKGWRYVREYIDKCCDLAERIHLGIYIRPENIFLDSNGKPDLAMCEALDKLWQAAEAEAETEKQKSACRRSAIQSKYMLVSLHTILNGKPDASENSALIDAMKDAGIIYQCERGDAGRVDRLDSSMSILDWRQVCWL